jgi:predicted metal-dependent phosphoesterase TrpH
LNASGRVKSRNKPKRAPIRLHGADLHVHTTHSDGGCSPGEVVRAAANVGLGALAITDHDTLSAIAVAEPEASRLGVELIPGIELTASREGREIHILGHFVRIDDPDLVAACSSLREGRARRITEMTGRLQALGLAIDLDTLRRTFPRATLGRKHLADWLVRSGQVASHREAFVRYLGDDGPAHVAKPRIPWREAIALIRGAGGVAGLAHPPYDIHLSTLRELSDAGLGAIEVRGPGIDARLGLRWRAWADELGLAPIAGTDFHAADRPGRWVGAITTSLDDLARLRGKRVASG